MDKFRKNTAEKRIPSELVVSLSELDECLVADDNAYDGLEASELALNTKMRRFSPIKKFRKDPG